MFIPFVRTKVGVRASLILVVLFLCNTLVGGVSPVFAAQGVIDPGFVARVYITNPNTGIDQLIVQPDGKVILSGRFTNVNADLIKKLVRLLPDGSVDPNFSGELSVSSAYRIGMIALQPDGKLVVALTDNTYRPILIRLNSDGSRDSSFVTPAYDSYFGVEALYVDSSNRIIAIYGYPAPIPIIIYNSDGSIYSTSGPDVYAIDSVGRLLALEVRQVDGENRPYLVRLLPDYTLDTSFTATPLNAWPRRDSIGFQSDGKIVSSGYDHYSFSSQLPYITRVMPNGGVDASFSYTLSSRVNSLTVRPDDSLIVSLFDSQPSTQRLLPDGTRDSNYVFPNVLGADFFISFRFLPDGKLLLYGSSIRAGNPVRIGIVRLLAPQDPAPPTPPACPVKRFWGDGSGSWGQNNREVYPAGTTFTLHARSSSAARGAVWLESNAINYLDAVGSTYTAPRQAEYNRGLLSATANTSASWVDIKVCGPETPPPPPTNCVVKRFVGDGTGSWGKYSQATYPAGTTFTLAARSNTVARGMVFVNASAVSFLSSLGSRYTVPSEARYNVGYNSSSANVATNWVEINICTPSGTAGSRGEEELQFGDEFAEPQALQYELFTPLIWNK